MEYRIKDVEKSFNCTVLGRNLEGNFEIDMDGKKRVLQVLSVTPGRMEFILDGKYHNVKYLQASTSAMNMVVDGIAVSLDMHSILDKIVYKNSGGTSKAASSSSLLSKIPGKVVSVAVKEGDEVKTGDTICTLESMKMQVGVKAHHDGKVTSLKVDSGKSVAKGDVIAEIE